MGTRVGDFVQPAAQQPLRTTPHAVNTSTSFLGAPLFKISSGAARELGTEPVSFGRKFDDKQPHASVGVNVVDLAGLNTLLRLEADWDNPRLRLGIPPTPDEVLDNLGVVLIGAVGSDVPTPGSNEPRTALPSTMVVVNGLGMVRDYFPSGWEVGFDVKRVDLLANDNGVRASPASTRMSGVRTGYTRFPVQLVPRGLSRPINMSDLGFTYSYDGMSVDALGTYLHFGRRPFIQTNELREQAGAHDSTRRVTGRQMTISALRKLLP